MSSPFDLARSLERARLRLADPPVRRRQRADVGQSRLPAAVASELRRLLGGEEFPGVQHILGELQLTCRRLGRRCPSRSTVYAFIRREPGPAYRVESLPLAVRAALYNLTGTEAIPGAQVAFYCFNYGALPALHFAAGMPWLPLHQAHAMRGWRPRSRGLLQAVLIARGIPVV